MIPAFTSVGLLPPGTHVCTIEQMRAVFGLGVRREQLLEGFDRCVRFMHSESLEGTLFVDGSFVTDKERPDDLELTLDVRGESQLLQERALLFQHHHFLNVSAMGIDWYPTLPHDTNFIEFFQSVGEKAAAEKRIPLGEKKGILRLDKW